jgi:hypothetical protein
MKKAFTIVAIATTFLVGCAADTSDGESTASSEALASRVQGTIAIVEAAPYTFGETIHVTYTLSGTTAVPAIAVFCTQNGQTVLTSDTWFAGGPQTTFALGPTGAWGGGAASCRLELQIVSFQHSGRSRWDAIATEAFDVGP